MGEAKRIRDKMTAASAQSEREARFHKRAQDAEGALLKAQAQIARMKAENDEWRANASKTISTLINDRARSNERAGRTRGALLVTFEHAKLHLPHLKEGFSVYDKASDALEMTDGKMTIAAGGWCEYEAVPATPMYDEFIVGTNPVTLTDEHIGKRPIPEFSYKIKGGPEMTLQAWHHENACSDCGKNWGEHRGGYSASKCNREVPAPPAKLQEAIEEVKRVTHPNDEWTGNDVSGDLYASETEWAIATILNAVVKGELK